MVPAGRGLQLLGALMLMVAPFLAWARVTVLGVPLGLPGLFLHGSALLGLGLVLSLAGLLGLRRPGLSLVCAGAGAWLTWLDLQLVLERTEYVLRRLQLSLSGLNETLARLNLQTFDLFQPASSPWEHVGPGFRVSAVGLGLVVLGALLETFARSDRTPLSVLLGRPRCSRCHFRVGDEMHFCPGCGAGQTTRPCPRCRRPLRPEYRFCPECGSEGQAGPAVELSAL